MLRLCGPRHGRMVGAGRDHGDRGTRAVRRPRLQPGGWAFEFANDNYPDIDDTAEVIMALRRAQGANSQAVDDACSRAASPGSSACAAATGGWGGVRCRQRQVSLVASLPFCDFGEVTDPPSADVTFHVLEMLALEPSAPDLAEPVAGAVDWLWRHQEPDGSWFGAAGGSTTSTAPVRCCRHSSPPGSRPPSPGSDGPSPGSRSIRARMAAGARDLRSYVDAGWARTERDRPPRRRRGHCWRCWPRASATARPPDGEWPGWWGTRPATGPGTNRSSPAPVSPAISPSTTTCTAWSGQ